MKRGQTGHYEVARTGEETVRAFVPDPLPPQPQLDLGGTRQRLLEQALLACGRLDGVSALLPDPDLFLYAYVRREAVLSSQIEGTQSSLSDLLLFELDEAPGVPFDDVVEVSNYVAALEHGMARLREGFPISNRLIREIHERLLARGRGATKSPGDKSAGQPICTTEGRRKAGRHTDVPSEFRRSQNWIGGTRPGNAHHVPPPPGLVADCMAALERFIHDETHALPVLVKAAVAHVQFETIHPFLDGNGRTGRLLIALTLHDAKVLRQPLLYLSLFLKQHRDEYYRLLDSVRRDGDWETWLEFFLEGVAQTATGAVETAHRLLALFHEDEQRIQTMGRSAPSALRAFGVLRSRPLANINEIVRRAGMSFPTASRALEALVKQGIVHELTGGRRNRVFAYRRYLALLNEDTEQPL